MRPAIIPREQVAEQLSVSPRVLVRYEARGLVQVARAGGIEGYEPAQIRRLWTIVTLQRDLGINLAGVEAVLKLRAQMSQLHRQLGRLAQELREILEPFDQEI
jgi:MerR family transcriptional regulator/heat shock protein HspR